LDADRQPSRLLLLAHASAVVVAERASGATHLQVGATIVATLRHQLPEDAWIEQDWRRRVIDRRWNVSVAIVTWLELEGDAGLRPAVEDGTIRTAAWD